MIKDFLRHQTAWIIFAACGALMGIAFLVYEIRFFLKNARELIALKEDYTNYVLGFKRAIAECHRIKRDRTDSMPDALKKKMNECDNVSFVILNRDPHTLYSAALQYARAAGIEEAWRLSHLSPDARRQEARAQARKKRIAKMKRRLAMHHHEQAMSTRIDERIQHDSSFVWPIEPSHFRLTSPFGPRRFGFHYGLDMAAPYGTPVRAVAHGVVIEARVNKGWGKTVVISHSEKLKTRYAHLSGIDVEVGDSVIQGQRIGRVGNTGRVRGRNGIHLHLEVLVYGQRVNPLLLYRQKGTAL